MSPKLNWHEKHELEVRPLLRIARQQAWILLLLDAAERLFLAPLQVQEFHQLAYLANCLIPLYEFEIENPEILKHELGPFYPTVQWELDRLVAYGLVTISEVNFKVNESNWHFRAAYAIAKAGTHVVHRMMESPGACRSLHYLCEAASAFASVDQAKRNTVGNHDATYESTPARSLIDLSDVGANLSVKTANLFQEYVREGVLLDDKMKLHLYFRYIDKPTEDKEG
jgi:hypothetical protein